MSPPSNEPRTNSLAFAKTDCHTCTANRRRCDRRRPRCSSCSGKSIICGGYPMQLTWSKRKPGQPEAAMILEPTGDPFRLEPLSLQASGLVTDRISRSRPRKPRKFKFVAEQGPVRKHTSTESREARIGPSTARPIGTQVQAAVQRNKAEMAKLTSQCSLSSPVLGALGDAIHDASPTHGNDQSNVSDSYSLALSFPNDFSSDSIDWWNLYSTDTMDMENSDILGELENSYSVVAMASAIDEENRSPSPSIHDPRQNLTALANSVLHKSLFGKFETLLNMYDQDFCVVPLSGDVPSNPFRCRSETSRGSQSLLHAILAVSCYHAGRKASAGDYPPVDVVDHQNTAIKLYRDELDTCTRSRGAQLLDTAMVLFLFNATQSAFGDWATHISDARKLLKLSGGADIWANNRKIQAQVVMLLWWDATIALLSRQGCLLPYSYFEALLALEDDRYWSFFDLIGCPRELVVPLMQLASLAEENEKASSMRWTKFDLTLVDEIQTSIINWKNSAEINDYVSEEQMQQQRDRWNCTEAWRYGLLLYISRVFRWNRNSNPPSKLAFYARLILEHVNSCRHTALIQKQALLPLFFAGSETKDQFSRQSIRDYCQYWGKCSGYNLFSTVSSVLEDVWTEQDNCGEHEVWWGSVIDKKQKPFQTLEAPLQFCFG